MEPALDQKLINLAFDPAASEGEAVNAFLAYRRKYGKIPSLSVPAPVTKPAKKFEAEWEMTVNVKKFDVFLFALQHWTKEPYYVIANIKDRSTLYDSWKFTLKTRHDTEDERQRFVKYIGRLFEIMRDNS